MSRRPKPTALKIATGIPGKRPLNKSEAKTVGTPRRPAHLSERAAAAWKYVVPILEDRGLAGDLDAWAIEMLCECYATILELRRVLRDEEDGSFTYETESESGRMIRPRPEVGMLADKERLFKGWLVEFGMTPAARSKVQASDPTKVEDPDEAFLRPAV